MFLVKLITIVGLLSLQGCGLDSLRNSTHDVDSEGYSQSALTGPYHSLTGWNQIIPYYIHEDVPYYLHDAIISSADSWNESIGYDVLSYAGISSTGRGSNLYSSLDDQQTIIYYELDWTATTDKPSTTLATTVWQNSESSDEIVRADIIMNAEMYMFQDSTWSPILDDSVSVIADCESIMLHEFGHLLGLQHVAEEEDYDSIMHAQTYIGQNVYDRDPSMDDISNIRQIYPSDKF